MKLEIPRERESKNRAKIFTPNIKQYNFVILNNVNFYLNVKILINTFLTFPSLE